MEFCFDAFLQVTGSFKARGAAHKMLSLPPTTTHIVTSSTGNHALAVLHAVSSLAARGRKLHATLFVPETISPEKASKLRKAGAAANAEIIATGKDCIEAEAAARVEAERSGGVYISPYNDLQVAAGQGTLAFELLMTIPAGKLDAVFVPVGGGGLMSGVAAVLKAVHPGVTIVGCQPERSDVMKRSVEAGFVVELPWQETLSDGTAGGIESDSVTLEYCSEFVDEWVTVSEKEIASAMVQVAGHHAMNVEGAAGVAVASYLKRADRWSGKHAVVVCCGGNVAAESLERAYELAGHHHSVSASGSRDFL
jgi:threonine dehydratase